MSPPLVIQLHPQDNIAVAVRDLPKGESFSTNGDTLFARDLVQMAHKIAIRPIAPGEAILKYGYPIGYASCTIEPGQWVHSHNVTLGQRSSDHAPSSAVPPPPTPITDRTFMGYRRAGGRAGTRNYIAVISTVNCSASVCRFIARRANETMLADFPNIDGVLPITHGGGCGMQFAGVQHELLNRTLAGFARHPNIGGYLLIGLGCEQGAMGYLVDSQNLVQIDGVSMQENGGNTGNPMSPAPPNAQTLRQGPPVLSIQDCGGTLATVEAGLEMLAKLLPRVNQVRREPIPASELILATECGGSDGASGVSANPALGAASDLVVAAGGTVILSETTEIYGAEQTLTRRAVTPQIAQKLIDRIKWWEWYTSVLGAQIDNNRSVGNAAGGLTTIYEKSLGAVAKAGSTALVDVYHYAEPVTAKGMVVMDTPGYDPPSVTGMVAGGANVVVFTTGRGSCFGCKPTPSIKVATNTPMYERMKADMDINAGVVLEGRPIADVGAEIFEKILAVASGEKTKSEALGIGDEEFVPWQIGPML